MEFQVEHPKVLPPNLHVERDHGELNAIALRIASGAPLLVREEHLAGYLSKDEILFANQKGKRWGARLTARGDVVLDGEREALSLSAAARRICGHQANGWQVWLVERGGHKRSLRRIREAYLEDQR